MLRKWTPQDKYFSFQNFPTQFHFSLFLECCGEIWRKLVTKYLHLSIEEGGTWMGKVLKGKKKSPTLKWKNRKLCWEPRQQIDRQLSKLRFKATVNVNVSRLVTCMSGRKPRFEIYVWQILFWRDSFVQDVDASVELRHHQSLSLKIFFFFSWQNGTLYFLLGPVFLFLFFQPGIFFCFWYFHEQRFFHKQRTFFCEFC